MENVKIGNNYRWHSMGERGKLRLESVLHILPRITCNQNN